MSALKDIQEVVEAEMARGWRVTMKDYLEQPFKDGILADYWMDLPRATRREIERKVNAGKVPDIANYF